MRLGGWWIANRVDAETWEQRLQRLFGSGTGNGGVLSVPPDAVVPQAGSGGLEPVGADRRARERVEYRVLASSFHDGTAMTAADVLYAYVFAYHWGGRAPGQARAEIFASKKKLEDLFGRSIEHFCYPYGDWNSVVRDWVMEAGYSTASTTDFGVNTSETSSFTLKRITARYRTRSLKSLLKRIRRVRVL